MSEETVVPKEFFTRISDALSEESDRASVILVASWLDRFLRLRLAQEFSEGNAQARRELFSSNGPFATFAAKVNVAYCAGWIESDVFHDVGVIRILRNHFAHSIDSHSLDDPKSAKLVATLQVPKRAYYDWGKIGAASSEDGALLVYSGERPDDAVEELGVSRLTFRMAASVIVAVLVSNLGLLVDRGGDTALAPLELLEHMRELPK